MKKISTILEERMKHVSDVNKRTEKYLEIVRDIIMGLNIDEYNITVKNIEYLKSIVDDIHDLVKPADSMLHAGAALYTEFTSIDASLRQLINIFENTTYSKMAIHNMSSTYTTNIIRERSLAVNSLDKYTSQSVETDDEIIDELFAASNVKSNTADAYSFIIDNSNIVNKFTIKLIGLLIDIVSNDKRRQLEVLVEKQKDDVIGAERINISTWVGVQGTIVRYGLIPATLSMPLAPLFTEMGLQYAEKYSPEVNFQDAAKTSHGLIVFNVANSSPIEFDIRGVADPLYIMKHQLDVGPTSGLNKKIIEKFQTAKMLAVSDNTNAKPLVIYAGKVPTWRIIETINGSLYRLLGRDGNTTIDSDQIAGILNGLSTRCHQYNIIQSEKIIKKCFDTRATNLIDEYDNTISQTYSGALVAAIVDKLTRKFEGVIKKEPIKTIEQFRCVSLDKNAIQRTLLEVLTHSTGTHGKGATEYMVTYLTKFDTIIWKFLNELDKQWSNHNISERIFDEYNQDEIHKMLISAYKNIIKITADELDKERLWGDYDISLKEYFMERKSIIV